MDVKLVLLMNCVAIVYCHNTISSRDDAEWQNEYFVDVKSEIESIRELLSTQQKAGVCNDKQAMQEMKSEIQEIRQSLSDQNQVLETLRNKWHETGKCPRGFTYLPLAGSCYKVVYESRNWTSAAQKCQELGRGSHLVAITSETENNALKTFLEAELLKNISICTPTAWTQAGNLFWTSGQRKSESFCWSWNPFVWKPSSDEMLPLEFTNWLPGEPNCKNRQEFCFHIWPMKNFTWNDESCSLKICPLCEYTP